MAYFCKNCGKQLREGARFCSACGTTVEQQMPQTVSCPWCGAEMRAGAKCPRCGKINNAQPNPGFKPAAPVNAANNYPRQNGNQAPIQPARQNLQRQAQQPAQRAVKQPTQRAVQQPAQRAVQQPRQQTVQQPAQRPVQQPKQQKPAKQSARPKKSNSGNAKKFPFKPVIIIAASVVLVAGFLITAFWAPGFLVNHSVNTKYTNASDENLSAMLDYAKRLEENGNYDAAAQIYSMIPDRAKDAANNEAKKIIENTPEKQVIDRIGEAREIINDVDSLKEDLE